MFNKKIKKVITIEGMMCEHCKEKVEKSVLKLKKEVFEDINIEELFVESTKITTKFNFQISKTA